MFENIIVEYAKQNFVTISIVADPNHYYVKMSQGTIWTSKPLTKGMSERQLVELLTNMKRELNGILMCAGGGDFNTF